MHKYRSHNCGEIRKNDIEKNVKLSGWIHNKRDHGGLLFIDLRDHYGITQIVFNDQKLVSLINKINLESVITVIGEVIARSDDTINKNLSTGEIEVVAQEIYVESQSDQIPFQINVEHDVAEDIRLKHRFLDLRRNKIHNNIILRSKVINTMRELMLEKGFNELQTPILTASSPEGARDYLVPSRIHPGKFYALPQAPQQHKQLYMMSGFDKYFQIAPCFRDEDSRADRSPGDFYQLDIEMSFATEEDIFECTEEILYNLFSKFSSKKISSTPFKRFSYEESMLKYGSDKPDLRIPIENSDATDAFRDSNFSIFKNAISKGSVVRAIPAPKSSHLSRGFFDKMIEFAISKGAGGLAYIIYTQEGEIKSPIAKFLNDEQLSSIKNIINPGDSVFFVCDKPCKAGYLSGYVRQKLGQELDLIDNDSFEFCWIKDFPFYELDEKGNIMFGHNPFSMPQGGLDILNSAKTKEDILNIKAYQYDIVCNGIELSSGAIRNHKLDILYKAFEIAGYRINDIENEFHGLVNAMRYGPPPHGGIAPGIDRIIMLLTDAPNLREVIAFPLNQQAEDVLMKAPSEVKLEQLRELNLIK